MENKLYKCIANANSDGGVFEIKFTDKTITRIGIDKPICTYGCIDSCIWNKPDKTCRIYRTKKRTGHALRGWGDGTFTIYFHQSGVPHYFEPIEYDVKEDLDKWL